VEHFTRVTGILLAADLGRIAALEINLDNCKALFTSGIPHHNISIWVLAVTAVEVTVGTIVTVCTVVTVEQGSFEIQI